MPKIAPLVDDARVAELEAQAAREEAELRHELTRLSSTAERHRRRTLRAENVLKASKAQLRATFEAWITEVDPRLAVDLIDFIYWEMPEISVEMILPLIGARHPSEIKKFILPQVGHSCSGCGQDEEELWSRTAYQAFLRDTKKGRNHWLCESCQQRRDAGWQQAAARRAVRLQQLRTMPYSEYLRTPEWDETRRAALKRARYRCQVCNRGQTVLDVHHRTYERRGDELARDLIVLCRDCHRTFHAGGKMPVMD
jgi:5-methylcytosine-specific restriction endonuclease McrA